MLISVPFKTDIKRKKPPLVLGSFTAHSTFSNIPLEDNMSHMNFTAADLQSSDTINVSKLHFEFLPSGAVKADRKKIKVLSCGNRL